MEYSTLGNPLMNGMSDSSVVHQQTVKAQEAPRQLLDPATVQPFTNQCMYGKSSDAHCNHQEQSLNYCRLQGNEYNLHNFIIIIYHKSCYS